MPSTEERQAKAGGRDTRRHLFPATRRDPLVLRALTSLPRAIFVRAEMDAVQYDERHMPTPPLQALLSLEAAGALIAAVEPAAGRRALIVGVGSGYFAAVLDRLGVEVTAAEPSAPMVEMASRNLALVGCTRVHVTAAIPAAGVAETGRFDAVLVANPTQPNPQELRRHLNIGGSLVFPTGRTLARQSIVRIRCRAERQYLEERCGEVALTRRLGELLLETGAATREQIEEAGVEAQQAHRKLGEVLSEKSLVAEPTVFRALAAQRGLKFGAIDLVVRHVDLRAVRSVPRSFLEHNRFLPITSVDGRLTIATCETCPNLADLGKVLEHRELEVCLLTTTDFRRLWAAVDMMLEGRGNVLVETEPTAEPDDIDMDEQHADEMHFVHLFDTLILEAIGERASDIHLERYGDRVRLRIRVDGDLRDLNRFRLSPAELAGLVNVIKIRSGLDIAEHRLPQGGRLRIRAGGKPYDLRVQTQPALYGEHAILRILPQEVKLLTVEDLGFPALLARQYRRLLIEPSGLILVVGPTGSGKTTTLYAALQEMARDATRKVITVEDPIEYAIEGVQQAQVRRQIGFSFAEAMQAFLREDPDVILVGEIRDHETAIEAMRASQTGHLVLSTLHCGDATDTVQRLLDLGIHPNTIGSELRSVIPQRLARRICENCRVADQPSGDLMRGIFPGGAPEGFHCYRGAGCERCSGFGTHGRVAVVEFLRVNTEIRSAISRGLPVHEMREVALRAGLVPMRDSALTLVRDGVIPLQELPVILASDRLAEDRAP